MTSVWKEFVTSALRPPPDNPYVRLLREKLGQDARVIRINTLVEESKGLTGYLVILEHRKHLSELRLPHSDAFTRWSLETGARMASIDEEAARFARLLQDRFAPCSREVGQDYFRSVLHEVLHQLAPPRTLERLACVSEYRACAGEAKARVHDCIDAILIQLVKELGEALHYSEKESSSILDAAFALHVVCEWQLDGRDHLFLR